MILSQPIKDEAYKHLWQLQSFDLEMNSNSIVPIEERSHMLVGFSGFFVQWDFSFMTGEYRKYQKLKIRKTL